MPKSKNNSSDNIFSEKNSSDKKLPSRKSSSSELSDTSDDTKSITFIKLKDDAKTEIRYVYHLSDIHIRNTQRHGEYREVFERTYQKLRNLIGTNEKTSIIVLTGDIMHTKTELSPEAISIAYHFFKSLNEIAPVIIIPGNHDCNLSNRSRMDALSPIVEDIGKLDSLFYLKKSGIYQYYNIVFGITSIFDNELVSADKIGSEIWKNVKQKKKYRIALYHGPVHGAKTDVGYRMNNEQLLADDFDGYDYVMLGDIHKYQYMNKEETVAYAGSLIQQSYGESLSNHGILKWDLIDGESELFEIKNDYGYCTVSIIDGKMVDTKIPRKPRIRFILENTNQLQYQEILSNLEKEYQICEIVKESNFRTNIHHNSPSQKKLKTEVTAYSTQESIIKKYLEKKGLDKEKISSLISLHKKIYQKILEDKKDQVADVMHNGVGNQKWKLLELKFSNTFSYGKNNVIDFRMYDPNKIIGIVAPNCYGKSAVLEIILFCLFDKFNRSDRRNILNKNEKTMYCSLLLSVGSQQYLIERMGQRSANGLTVKIDVNFYSIIKNKKGEDIMEKLNGIDKNETNKKITSIIGDYDDYIKTCFWLQKDKEKKSDFIDMTQLQKQKYLNEILKLNVFEDCYKMAKEKLNKLLAELKFLEQKAGNKSMEDIKNKIISTSSELKKLSHQKTTVCADLSKHLEYIVDKSPLTSIVKYNELSEYDLTSEDSILDTIEKLKNKLSKKTDIDITNIENNVKKLKEKLHLEENIEQKENDKLAEEKRDIQSLTSQKEKLIKKLIHIPKKADAFVLDKYITDKENALHRISAIDKTLDEHSNNNLSEKINKIDQLEKLIQELKKTIKPVDQNAEQKLQVLKSKLSDNKKIIHEHIDSSLNNLKLDPYEKTKLTHSIINKRNFVQKLEKNIELLDKYQHGSNGENDTIIDNIRELNKTWHDNYKILINKENDILANCEKEFIDMDSILCKSKHLVKEIGINSIDLIISHENDIINERIRCAELELETLSKFRGTKKEINKLLEEKQMLCEKIKLAEIKIKEFADNEKNTNANIQVQNEIDALKAEIDTITKNQKTRALEIKEIKKTISECENIIDNHKNSIEKNKKYTNHLNLLREYHFVYMDWYQKNEFAKKWIQIKKDYDGEIKNLTREIEKRELELSIYKKDVEEYFEHRKKFDEKSTETNNYQLYVQVMNCNGLPYEMLKTYLPLIESDVNQILHSMVNFNIKFMFHDESQLEEQKKNQIKSSEGCIDVDICYQNMKIYSAELASGFEMFIIGLAIRMTLCQISLTAKPNFLIIDEGWGCLDSENLGNINTIMNYIKTQYEHVIIISHLDELKNQADYVININKVNGYSHVKTDTQIFTRRGKLQHRDKKLKSKKKIIVV